MDAGGGPRRRDDRADSSVIGAHRDGRADSESSSVLVIPEITCQDVDMSCRTDGLRLQRLR
jgi:hypothetical protein